MSPTCQSATPLRAHVQSALGTIDFLASSLYARVGVATAVGYYAATDRRRILAVFRTRTLRFFGDIRYWLYLSHFLAKEMTMKFLRIYYRASYIMAESHCYLSDSGYGHSLYRVSGGREALD
jgi:hypothetical protein